MTFQGSGWVVSCVWTSCHWSWEASDGRGCHTAAATSIKAGVGTGSMLCVHCFIYRKADSPHGQDIVVFQERALRRQHGEVESWHAWLASSLRLFSFFSPSSFQRRWRGGWKLRHAGGTGRHPGICEFVAFPCSQKRSLDCAWAKIIKFRRHLFSGLLVQYWKSHALCLVKDFHNYILWFFATLSDSWQC